MKRICLGMAIGVALLMSSVPAGAYMETFDTGSAGWGNDTMILANGGVNTAASLWSSSGGNLGGYIYGSVPAASTGADFYAFNASLTPSEVAKFGNLTGTTLTTDLKASGIGLTNAAGPTPFARFYVGSGATYFVSNDAFSWNPNSATNWTTYQAAVNPADFILWPIQSGSLTFAQVIANPTDIGIVFTGSAANIAAANYAGLGINGPNTTIELDNFGTLPSQAVPEAPTLLLLGVGLFGVGLFSNRRIAQQ